MARPATRPSIEPVTAEPGVARPTRPTSADEQAPAEASAAEPTADADGADATDSAADAPPAVSPIPTTLTTTSLIFHAPPVLVPSERPERDDRTERGERAERGDRGEGADESSSVRRRTRRRTGEEGRASGDEPANTVVKVRQPREPELITEPQKVKGSTRLEAKKQRRRDGRDAGRRRPVITEAEFLARRECVDRVDGRAREVRPHPDRRARGRRARRALRRAQPGRIAHRQRLPRPRAERAARAWRPPSSTSAAAATPCSTRARSTGSAAAENGEKNQPRRIELALKPGDRVLVQVTKDPVGHKGARLTSQVSLPGRYLVYVPNGSMNGISRKLPDTERARLKKILKEVLPDERGRHRAHRGRGRDRRAADARRQPPHRASGPRSAATLETVQAPALLHSEPDLLIKIVRDVFNEDFQKMVIEGDDARETIERYLARRRARPARPRRGATRASATRSTSTASASRSRRRSTARSGCPRAARSSSTAPRR